MPLTNAQAKDAARQWARKYFEELGQTAGYDLDTLTTQITNLVTFMEANATAINNQFSEPFKTNASVPEKRYMLAIAAAKLAGII
jgi:hypothetical protein